MALRTAVAALQLAFARGWVYANPGQDAANGAAQEATWGGLCGTGHEQSPINVLTRDVVGTPLSAIATNFNADASYVKNTGHGFQLFETSPNASAWNHMDGDVDSFGGAPKGFSWINGEKYNFYQVHWHTPSENTVDNVSFPLEAHFVHQLDDSALHGTYHRLAVIGLLYQLDNECDPFLDQFWDDFPVDRGEARYNGSSFDLNTKLTEELSKGYYHWFGSLTTPPCTEGVSWNLLKTPQKVCQRQVDTLKIALQNTQDGINFNNRVTQPLNHRVVTEQAAGTWTPSSQHVNPPQGDEHWLYAQPGETSANSSAQASTWGGLCVTGQEQSPINIVTAAAAPAPSSAIATHFDATASYVKNTGHGFQLFETSPHSSAWNATSEAVDSFDGVPKGFSWINGAQFNFYQVHWHTPSENTVDGRSFPLEAHFVHQLNDPALHGTFHRLAVIGLLYELDDECDPFLDKFWDDFPDDKGQSEYTGGSFDLNEKLTEELSKGYYHWWGSLTTPPCTEGVSWNLLKTPQKVCQAQVERLKDALNNTQSGISFNNRVTQPLNHRVVTEPAAVSLSGSTPAPKNQPHVNGAAPPASFAALVLASAVVFA